MRRSSFPTHFIDRKARDVMKLSKKQQVSVLAALLVLAAAGGTAAFLLTGKDSPKPESSLSAATSATEASQTAAKQQKPLPEGVYHQQETQEGSYFGDTFFDFQGEIVWYKGLENGSVFVNQNGTIVKEIPQTSPSNYIGMDFHGNILKALVDENTYFATVNRYDQAGEIDRTVELKELHKPDEGQYLHIRKILADDSYLYVLGEIQGADDSYLQVYDWDGNLIVEYGNTQDVAIDGKGTFYSLTGELQQQTAYAYLQYNLNTQKEVIVEPIYDFPYQIEYNRYDQRVYLATQKGVGAYYTGRRQADDYSNNANMQYILTLGKDTSFFSENMWYLTDFAIAEDRSLTMNFIGFEGEGENFRTYQQIIPFTFTEGAVEEKEPTFTLTVPYASDFLKEAVIRFEKAYPEEHVELDAAYPSKREYQHSSDLYRDKISTRLMSGDVGDVVSLSGEGLPVQNFLQSDALLDLNPYLEESGLSTTLNPNILDAVKMNGATRGLPVTYHVPCLVADGALAEKMGVDLDSLTSWADIFRLLPKLKETAPNAPLFNGYKSQMAWSVMDNCLSELIDVEQKTVSLNEDWFRETLESLKEVYEDPLLIKEQEFSIVDPLMGSMFAVFDLGSSYLGDDFGRAVMVPEQRFLPMPGSQALEFGEIYGIAASSDHPDAAWKFLEYLYCEDIQTLPTRLCIPVTQEGWNDFQEQQAHYDTLSDQQRMEDFETIVQGADTLGLPKEIPNLFGSHLQKYLNGEETLDQMLKAAEEEIWLCLNE